MTASFQQLFHEIQITKKSNYNHYQLATSRTHTHIELTL